VNLNFVLKNPNAGLYRIDTTIEYINVNYIVIFDFVLKTVSAGVGHTDSTIESIEAFVRIWQRQDT
jgi:hypothetical protein